jgi:hypothetical protein
MVLIGCYFYYHDTKVCRDTLNNIDEICSKYKTTYVTVNSLTPSFTIPSIKEQIDKINSIKLVPNGS